MEFYGGGLGLRCEKEMSCLVGSFMRLVFYISSVTKSVLCNAYLCV